MRALSGEPDDGLSGGLSRLIQAPLLTQEEEIVLTRAAKAGDAKAKARLVESNMRLVIGIARGYRNRQIPLEDLVQEGAIGLMNAADRFDPDRGFRFSTYATHWVRQAIGRAIDGKARSIRLPSHVAQSLRKIERTRADLARLTGYEPTHEALAYTLGITPKKLAALLEASHELLSIETPVGEGSATLGGTLRDADAPDAERRMIDQEAIEELARILSELNDRERRVMQIRYPLDGTEPLTPADVQNELHVSRDRLRQIEADALRKLREIVRSRSLAELFDRSLPEPPPGKKTPPVA